MRSLPLIIVWSAMTLGLVAAQNNSGPDTDLFDGIKILRLRIELTSEQVAALRHAPREDVSVVVHEGGVRYEKVGLHLKGATGSFRPIDDRPSFTLSFDDNIGSQRFHGLGKVHLNNSVEDPARMNELLGSELFRAAGIPAARVAYAVVELNNRPLGLYVLKEGFSRDFLQRHFPDGDSRLYEPGPGHDVNEELDEKGDRAEVRSESLDKLSAIANLADLDERWRRFPEALDVERFLSFMALEVMLGHRDGYCIARNNFRVAVDGVSNRVVFIPHGMDQLFGSVPRTTALPMSGLIASSVLETSAGLDAYHARFGVLLTNVFVPAKLLERVDTLSATIETSVSRSDRGAFKDAVAELRKRIVERHRSMQTQLAFERKSVHVPDNGIVALSHWWKFGEPAEGAMREVKGANGDEALHIQAGPRTTASWRTSVRLPPGRYRFEGRVRTDKIRRLAFGDSQGAALRLWSPASVRSPAAPLDSEGHDLRLEFELAREANVYLGCEVRASAGEAWFEKKSLRVIRLR